MYVLLELQALNKKVPYNTENYTQQVKFMIINDDIIIHCTTMLMISRFQSNSLYRIILKTYAHFQLINSRNPHNLTECSYIFNLAYGHENFTKLCVLKYVQHNIPTTLMTPACNKCVTCMQQIQQVDILISKNQALQTLYLKHCVYKTT